MKKAIYIGMCQKGSTSLMRYESLVEKLDGRYDIKLINIQKTIDSTPRILRSIGWRYKVGPLINKINALITSNIDENEKFEFIWIDKGVFIYPEVLFSFKKQSKKIIHFTPDPAFFYHKSKLFNEGLKYYSHVITTKAFELDVYKQKTTSEVLLCTQGFDDKLHYPRVNFDDKKFDVSFVGHYEKNRGQLIKKLLKKGFTISIAGPKWKQFFFFNMNKKNLVYSGKYLHGEDYSRSISNAYVSIGFLSKWIPELHTTRTFEIPACGTALISERTSETNSFFDDDEVYFFNNSDDFENIVQEALLNKELIRQKSQKSHHKVNNGNFSHSKIIGNLLKALKIE
jgi:spore maturation protein CgeB